MENIAEIQYELVKQSREVLFGYCETVSPTDFVKENNSFGRGSMRNLLVHTGNTYEFWIGKHALGRDQVFTSYGSINTVNELRAFYNNIDLLTEEFFRRFTSGLSTGITIRVSGRDRSLSPLELFTHVITHEFHHKGQVLSLSRHLGYIPVDTDIIQ